MAGDATFLAADLGAESGRVFLGRLEDGSVEVREVHRFPNEPVRLADGLHWNVLRIFAEIKEGMSKAVRDAGRIESVGVDSWAVDYGLLDRDGALVSNPYHYRDAQTESMIGRALERASREEIYQTTGIQFIRINTLYQLLALENSPSLEIAEDLLMIPDLINFWLTGEKVCEFTNATTTQLYDQQAGDWAWGLLEKMGLPSHIFQEVVSPATEVGTLSPEIADEVGVGTALPVTAVASHDTASAVAAIPAEDEDFAYISSGTWSLVGVETQRPVLTQEAMRSNFTNEGGFGGMNRFLKNVMGLWLLQECRRTWTQEGAEYSYEELGRMAEAAPGSGSLVDPDHPSFLAPGDMPTRIAMFCRETGQRPPEGPAEVVRCVLESLALKYRWVVERAAALTGKSIGAIHVVGGGSRNTMLCQLTADATGLPVLAGPVEATALGNLLIQAYARGYLDSVASIRATVRGSSEVRIYEPDDDEGRWDELRGRFSEVMESGDSMDVQRVGASD